MFNEVSIFTPLSLFTESLYLEIAEVTGDSTKEDSDEEEEQVAAAPRTSPRLSGRTPVVCPIQALGAGNQVGYISSLPNISGDAGAYPPEADSAIPVVGDLHQGTQVDEHVPLRHEPSVPPTVLPAVTPTAAGQQVGNISPLPDRLVGAGDYFPTGDDPVTHSHGVRSRQTAASFFRQEEVVFSQRRKRRMEERKRRMEERKG